MIEVPFSKEGQLHILIGQVDLLVGENVKIGTSTRQGGLSILGVGVDFVSTEDLAETRVRATAKIIAFIDPDRRISAREPTIDYMAKPVFRAARENLRAVFSVLDNTDLAALEIGTLLGTSDVIPVSFNPSGLMRHTAIFGQSGSGKSFSFGILLEEIIDKTDARIFVLDTNSDYRHFSHLRTRADIIKYSKREYSSETHEIMQERWRILAQSFAQWSRKGSKLALAFSDLNRKEQTSLLGIDPMRDREEYSVCRETVEELASLITWRILLGYCHVRHR